MTAFLEAGFYVALDRGKNELSFKIAILTLVSMTFPNVFHRLLSYLTNQFVLNIFKQWELISSIKFVIPQSAF